MAFDGSDLNRLRRVSNASDLTESSLNVWRADLLVKRFIGDPISDDSLDGYSWRLLHGRDRWQVCHAISRNLPFRRDISFSLHLMDAILSHSDLILSDPSPNRLLAHPYLSSQKICPFFSPERVPAL
jgi:hypothetical protein